MMEPLTHEQLKELQQKCYLCLKDKNFLELLQLMQQHILSKNTIPAPENYIKTFGDVGTYLAYMEGKKSLFNDMKSLSNAYKNKIKEEKGL